MIVPFARKSKLLDKTMKARYGIYMKIANYEGRAFLIKTGTGNEKVTGIDIAKAGDSGFETVQSLLENWDAFTRWYADFSQTKAAAVTQEIDAGKLCAPVPFPRQIFAVGMNYKSHASEIGLALPASPSIFTKFASSIAAPYCDVTVRGKTTDWEVELVAVIKQPVIRGKKLRGRNISRENAPDFVAGYMIGQDLSDRTLQFACNPAQFSLGKSHENFAPVGPWITTPDEIGNPLDLALECRKNGEIMQSSNTRHMIFDVFDLICRLSQTVELLSGDLLFTGTPEGVGQGRKPPVFLQKGDELVSTIAGLGEIRQQFI